MPFQLYRDDGSPRCWHQDYGARKRLIQCTSAQVGGEATLPYCEQHYPDMETEG